MNIYEETEIKEKTLKNYISSGNILSVISLDGLEINKEQSVYEFEKTICNGNTITDCVIHAYLPSGNIATVGIEIKSEYDTTRRLAKQITDYLQVCDYVYIFAHEKHTQKIRNILKNIKGGYKVGIISYTEYDNEILAYLEKGAKTNTPNHYQYVNSFLKRKQLGTIIKQYYGKRTSTITGTTRKPQLINYLIQTKPMQEIKQKVIQIRVTKEAHFGHAYVARKYSNRERRKYARRKRP